MKTRGIWQHPIGRKGAIDLRRTETSGIPRGKRHPGTQARRRTCPMRDTSHPDGADVGLRVSEALPGCIKGPPPPLRRVICLRVRNHRREADAGRRLGNVSASPQSATGSPLAPAKTRCLRYPSSREKKKKKTCSAAEDAAGRVALSYGGRGGGHMSVNGWIARRYVLRERGTLMSEDVSARSRGSSSPAGVARTELRTCVGE